MAQPPSPDPVAIVPDEPAVEPRWWGGCCGCLLFLLSAALTVTALVAAVWAVVRLWS